MLNHACTFITHHEANNTTPGGQGNFPIPGP